MATVLCLVITLSSSNFRESFQNLRRRRVSRSREYFIQLNDIQELGYVCVYVVKTKDVVIKRKSLVQKVCVS